MNQSLFTLALEYVGALVETEGEETPEIEQKAQQLVAKVDACAAVLDQLPIQAKLWREKAAECAAVAKRLENNEKRLKDYIKAAMVASGQSELLGDETRFTLSESPASLVVDNAAAVPDEFKTQIVETVIQKDALKDALKAGKNVAGAHLEYGKTLRRGRKK